MGADPNWLKEPGRVAVDQMKSVFARSAFFEIFFPDTQFRPDCRENLRTALTAAGKTG